MKRGGGVQIAGAPAKGPLCRQWFISPRRFFYPPASSERKTNRMNKHQEALERTIAAGASTLSDRQAALIALCRELALRMDEEGDDTGLSTRLVAAYLSALKDLTRAMSVNQETKRTGKLSQLRAVQREVETMGRATPSRKR